MNVNEVITMIIDPRPMFGVEFVAAIRSGCAHRNHRLMSSSKNTPEKDSERSSRKMHLVLSLENIAHFSASRRRANSKHPGILARFYTVPMKIQVVHIFLTRIVRNVTIRVGRIPFDWNSRGRNPSTDSRAFPFCRKT